MRILLKYGKEDLQVDLPASNATVLRPRFIEGLANESTALLSGLRTPIGSPPLKDIIKSRDTVAMVIPDITRPFPSARVLPVVLEGLSHVPASRIVIINGTGSHRANTPDELAEMVGRDIAGGYRLLNHNAYDPETLRFAGTSPDGRPVLLNKEYVGADKRIVLGSVEPHFFAGYSGGYKGVFPGVADIDSIMHFHRPSVIGDPRSTWGRLEENPTQEQIRANGSLLPVDFCINVALNHRQDISRVFCGDLQAVHQQACDFVKATAMVACEEPFHLVITTNGGYPLDQNLYQTVKGMSAAAQIVRDGGLILTVSQCRDGFPAHGNFRKLLFRYGSPEALLDAILGFETPIYDQWEAQTLAMILQKARVALHSEISGADVRKAHLEPVTDLRAFLDEQWKRIGKYVPIAVLPEGPATIPYIAR